MNARIRRSGILARQGLFPPCHAGMRDLQYCQRPEFVPTRFEQTHIKPPWAARFLHGISPILCQPLCQKSSRSTSSRSTSEVLETSEVDLLELLRPLASRHPLVDIIDHGAEFGKFIDHIVRARVD